MSAAPDFDQLEALAVFAEHLNLTQQPVVKPHVSPRAGIFVEG